MSTSIDAHDPSVRCADTSPSFAWGGKDRATEWRSSHEWAWRPGMLNA